MRTLSENSEKSNKCCGKLASQLINSEQFTHEYYWR